MCADTVVKRMPSAPRLNLLGAREAVDQPADKSPKPHPPAPHGPAGGVVATAAVAAAPPDLQAAWLGAVRELMARTDDVGERFAEEARRMHYGETPGRGIRGQATPEQRAALLEEGIETIALPVPHALKGPVQ